MIKKALAATGIALGLAVAVAPFAHADGYATDADMVQFYRNSPTGPDQFDTYWDRTFAFTTPTEARAFDPGNLKLIVLSPYGTTHPIECKGAGHHVQITCRQLDDAEVAHLIQPVAIGPFKTFYVYNPLAD